MPVTRPCPECKTANHVSCKKCAECGHEFYFRRNVSKRTIEQAKSQEAKSIIMELLEDIRAFSDMITYYEGRRLKKQIALEEILHSRESRE